ncbi:unnamed protein product, partial [Tetraodon nigroviridis]
HPDFGGERIPSLNWYEDNDIKSFLGKDGTEDTDLDRDNNTTPFCQSLIQGLESNPLSRIIWRGIKPLFTGKLLYTPDTSAVRRVMKENLLKRPEVAVLVNLRLENTSWTASRITRFLSTPSPDVPRQPGASSTWLDVYNDLNQTITTLAKASEVHFRFPH